MHEYFLAPDFLVHLLVGSFLVQLQLLDDLAFFRQSEDV